MLTTTYSDILNRAAELAGRTRDKLPVSEATMMSGFIAIDLEEVWVKQLWPDLIPDIAAVTVSARNFSKQETTEDEMGDILGVFASGNPQVTTKFRCLDFEERDDKVWIFEDLAQVYVEWMLPAPDLTTVAAADLPATTIPRRFRNYLALRAAGLLRNSDVEGAGGTLLALAETALGHQIQRLPPNPIWRRVKGARDVGRVKIPALAG